MPSLRLPVTQLTNQILKQVRWLCSYVVPLLLTVAQYWNLSFNGSDLSHAVNFVFDERSCQSAWKKKKPRYIVATSTEGVSEEVRDQAVGLPGINSMWTFQRTQFLKCKQNHEVLFVFFFSTLNFIYLYILKWPKGLSYLPNQVSCSEFRLCVRCFPNEGIRRPNICLGIQKQ